MCRIIDGDCDDWQKKGKNRRAQLDGAMHTACALCCVQYTHTRTREVDDGLANKAGSLARDLQHSIL